MSTDYFIIFRPGRRQGCQFGPILGAKYTFLPHRNIFLTLKLIQTGNPGRRLSRNRKKAPKVYRCSEKCLDRRKEEGNNKWEMMEIG